MPSGCKRIANFSCIYPSFVTTVFTNSCYNGFCIGSSISLVLKPAYLNAALVLLFCIFNFRPVSW